MRGHRWADDPASFADMQRKVPQSVGACYELIENGMLKGPWVMGAAYTIADPYLFTLAQWLEDDGVDPARIPRVIEHRSRMAERPNVRKAIAEELRHLLREGPDMMFGFVAKHPGIWPVAYLCGAFGVSRVVTHF